MCITPVRGAHAIRTLSPFDAWSLLHHAVARWRDDDFHVTRRPKWHVRVRQIHGAHHCVQHRVIGSTRYPYIGKRPTDDDYDMVMTMIPLMYV